MMQHRAILTGTIQKATYYNKPLPRMKVQPIHVSMMIHKRIRAYTRRQEQHWTLMSLVKHVETEATFERMLEENAARFGQTFERVFDSVSWREHVLLLSPPFERLNSFSTSGDNLGAELRKLQESFNREKARLHAPVTNELIEIVRAARREKHRNLTNEKIRERRGEMTRKWLKRRRSHPPPLLRYRMTEKEKMTWWVSKCVSEVGYIGKLKRQLGIKLKNPDAWKREHGLPHMEEETARDLAVVEMGNRRREKLGSGFAEE
jgi:hypothetical protein